MRTIVYFLAVLGTMWVAGCTAFALWVFFHDPIQLDKINTIHPHQNEERWKVWLRKCFLVASIIGLIVMVYAATTTFLWWLPQSWRDGEGEWIGHFIGLMVGFFGGIAIVSGMSDFASAMGKNALRALDSEKEIKNLQKRLYEVNAKLHDVQSGKHQ